jgi:HK97 family phage major capsid protein
MSPEPSAIAQFGWLCRAKGIASKAGHAAAADWLAENGAPASVRQVFKAAIGAGSTTDSDLGALGSYGISIGQWTDSLRTRSAFYRIMADAAFTRVPLRTRVGLVVSTATAGAVAEGHAIPVSKVKLDNLILEPMKAGGLIVVTDELLRSIGVAGQSLLNRELAAVVSDAVDAAFLDLIVDTGTTSTASAGTTAVNAKHDLRTALLAVTAVGAPKLYWIVAPDVAKKASTLADTAGLDAFPAMSAAGGEMANLPAVVSSGVPAGEAYLVNAAGIAADAGPVTVDVSSQADIQMDTAPTTTSATPTASTLVSMFASNSTALRCDAWFGAQVLRDDTVAVITGINWT